MHIAHDPVIFQCEGCSLVGIIERPADARANRIGVLIVTGGPQYRAGSHRQFVEIARKFASAGIPSMRFDYRGMGDSEGSAIKFDECMLDIRSAIDTLVERTGVDRIVLWGLCDAASACMIYGREDPRVDAMVLLNPWVRSEATLAKTYIRHHYLRRLFSSDFWRKLIRGRAPVLHIGREFLRNLRASRSGDRAEAGSPLPVSQETDFRMRMLQGIEKFDGEALILLCGNDLTAAEFSQFVESSPRWSDVMNRTGVTVKTLDDMDHTFSREVWRQIVVNECLSWIFKIQSVER